MIAYILLGIFTLLLIIGQVKNADIIIAPITGFMVGALYNKEDFEEKDDVRLTLLEGDNDDNVNIEDEEKSVRECWRRIKDMISNLIS